MPAQPSGMIRIAMLLATALPLTACIGPSRTPGRLSGTLVTLTGAALVFEGATADCTGLGCVGSGMHISAGTTLLLVGIAAMIINEVRYVPPAVEESPSPQLPERCTVVNAHVVSCEARRGVAR